MEGDSASARASLAAIEEARFRRPNDKSQIHTIVLTLVTPGGVGSILDALGMARKLNRYSQHARHMLAPWIVDAALRRLGSRRLSVEEQEVVVDATLAPDKVNWPSWWSVRQQSN
jgi:hypothetical protein